MGYNLGGGMFDQVISVANAAEQRRRQNDAQAMKMMQAGFINTADPPQREGHMASVFGGGPQFDASQWTPGAHHAQVAAGARNDAIIAARASENALDRTSRETQSKADRTQRQTNADREWEQRKLYHQERMENARTQAEKDAAHRAWQREVEQREWDYKTRPIPSTAMDASDIATELRGVGEIKLANAEHEKGAFQRHGQWYVPDSWEKGDGFFGNDKLKEDIRAGTLPTHAIQRHSLRDRGGSPVYQRSGSGAQRAGSGGGGGFGYNGSGGWMPGPRSAEHQQGAATFQDAMSVQTEAVAEETDGTADPQASGKSAVDRFLQMIVAPMIPNDRFFADLIKGPRDLQGEAGQFMDEHGHTMTTQSDQFFDRFRHPRQEPPASLPPAPADAAAPVDEFSSSLDDTDLQNSSAFHRAQFQTGAVAIPNSSRLAKVNNNPGNLKFAGQPGASEGEGGFAFFETPEEGFRQIVRQVELDSNRGLTLGDFINKYAPPSENDTTGYVDFILDKTGETDPMVLLSDMDPYTLSAAMATMESGTVIQGR